MNNRNNYKAILNNQLNDNSFYKLFMQSIDLFCITDKNGFFIKMNAEWLNTMGYDNSDLEEKPLIEFIYPEDVVHTNEILKEDVFRDNEVMDFTSRFKHKNGNFRWLEWRSFSDGDLVFSSARDITEQKDSKDNISKSQKLLNDSQRIAKMGSWEYNVENNIIHLGNSMQNLFGIKTSIGPLNFISFLQLIHPEDRRLVQGQIEIVLKSGKTENVECRIILSNNGEIRNFIISAEVVKIENEKPIKIIGVVQDITESKIAKEALIESEEKARLFVENTPLPIAMFDTNMCYMLHSKRWTIDYKLSQQQLIGRSHYEIFPEIQDQWKDDHQRVLKGEIYKNDADKFVRSDGSVQWLRYELYPWYRSNNTIGGLVMFTEDITDRIEAQEALRVSEQKLQSIFRVAPVGIGVINKRVILDVNPYICKICSYSKHELIGKDLQMLYHSEKEYFRVIEVLSNLINEFGTGELETLWKRKDGTLINIYLALTPIDPDNYSSGQTFMVLDITDEKEAERQLIAAKEKAEESDRLKSAFLANMSHEIRTPMNGILGFAELLKEPGLTGETQQEYISIIEKGGIRMLNIINDIVDISKIESGQMKISISETNVNEQIEFIYNFFKTEVDQKGIQLSIHKSLSSAQAILKTDREKLYSILTNLLKNAIKYSEIGTIEFGYKLRGSQLEFFVSDTGIGIPKEKQKVIFERFIQADIEDRMARQGAGLGLAISKSYIEMLGGRIWVESAEGKGSTFYFTLPYQQEIKKMNISIQNHEYEQFECDDASMKTKLKILIAEDDEPSEMFISIAVKKLANETIIVHSGTEAVATCFNNPDIDVVLMDILLPEMNGYEATRQIRKFNKEVVIIAQTAYALEGDKEKAIAAGCDGYISKPIKADELKQKIFECLNKE